MDGYMKKRYINLFETGKFSDCCFFLDDEKILAHKVILATCSPVFEAMFFGSLASPEVQIKDMYISVLEFNQMLAFIYTDSVQINSIANAWSLVYIAKKYLIDDLLHYCLTYIGNKLEASNVLLNYEFADLFNEESIRNLCMNNVKMYPKIILNCDYHMKPTTLCTLLEQDKCNANEQDLINATIKWASTECQRQNVEITKENIRSLLEETGALSRLRFLTLPVDLIIYNNNKQLEILDDDEKRVLKLCKLDESFENKCKLKNLNLCLNDSPRSSIPLLQKFCFRERLKTGVVYHANEESKLTTEMTVNKCVLVNGFMLPTRRAPKTSASLNYTEDLKITITDKSSQKMLHLSYTRTVLYETIHTVKISEPFLFEEGRRYDVDITWSSQYLHWANEYTMHYFSRSLVHKDIEFEFNDPFDCGFIQGVLFCPI